MDACLPAGVARPTIQDWIDVNSRVPRIVDALPNGPHPTVRVFLAGGVPEVMLHVREMGLLDERALTASGEPLGAALDWWAKSERRARLRDRLHTQDGDPLSGKLEGPCAPSGRARFRSVW